jgi:hypothetical protein
MIETCWTITNDLYTDETAKPATNGNARGIVGPRGCKLTAKEIIANPLAIRFQMFDDDGELYYSGLMLPGDDGDLLAPLDDFGTPNAGCTTIKVANFRGGWDIVN